MAYFAELNNENIVIRVIQINNEIILDDNGVEQEQLGIDFCKQLLNSENDWKKTSFNNSIRKNFASVNFIYDSVKDIFIPPKPFDSWILDENDEWQPPVNHPNDGSNYRWNEDTQNWEIV